MAQALIRFARGSRPPIPVEVGQNLMQSLLDAQVPVASSCHGDGVCAKCRLVVTSGKENLSPIEETEAFLQERENLGRHQRISCQVRVLGDVTVDAPYW